jgi:transposase-like protein
MGRTGRGCPRGGPDLAAAAVGGPYPVIYLDALVVKVRDGAHVRNKAVHIAVGVDMEGIKHVLGIPGR